MKKMIKTIPKKLWRNKLLLIPVIALAVAVPLVVFAQATTSAASQVDPQITSMYRTVANFLIMINELAQRVMWPILLMIGGLLKNDILFDAGMEERLVAVWSNVRNIVNVLFVLIILGIAFYNVVGGNDQNYQVKTVLPKFIFALLAINFSYIACKVAIDSSNVLTTAIFALPGTVQTGLDRELQIKSDVVLQQKVCEGLYGKDNAEYQANLKNSPTKLCSADAAHTLNDEAKLFFNKWDANNAAIVMATQFMKAVSIDTVFEGVKSAKDLTMNILFSAALYVVYLTSFLALFIILLVRLIVLWVAIAIMPLTFLPKVLPESLKKQTGKIDDVRAQFVKHAIVPIPIALMMTIGFVMVMGLQRSTFDASWNQNLSLATSTLSVGFMTSGISTFKELIIALATVAIIWTSVLEAASGTMAHKIVDKITGAVKGVGNYAVGAITQVPFIPIQVTDNTGKQQTKPFSLGAFLSASNKMTQGQESSIETEAQSLATALTGKDSFEAQRKMKESKSVVDFNQHALNAGHQAFSEDGPAQKEMARKMLTIPDFRNFYRPYIEHYSNKDGKQYTYESFMADLKAGKADPKTVYALIQKAGSANGQRMQTQEERERSGYRKAEPQRTAAGTGAAAAGAVAGAAAGAAGTAAAELPTYSNERADNIINYSHDYESVLDGKQKAAIAKFQKAKLADREKMIDKNTKENKVLLEAIALLDSIQEGQISAAAVGAASAPELDQLISKRKKDLEGKKYTPDQIETILARELAPVYERTKSSPQLKTAYEGSRELTPELRNKIEPPAATPAPAAAAPAQPGAQPAAASTQPSSPPTGGTPPSGPPPTQK